MKQEQQRSTKVGAVCGAFLISDLKRSGSTELLQTLSDLLPTIVQPAIWVQPDEMTSPELFDSDHFQARHLRAALPGEVGTALAHRKVCEQIGTKSGDWWVVFEDDADIHNPGVFLERLEQLASAIDLAEPCVINLNYLAAKKLPLMRNYRIQGIWQPAVATYTTTAYLINRSAAALIVNQQTPIRSQPDWPIDTRTVRFLQETMPLVSPRSDIASVADPSGLRTATPRYVRFRTWSWVWYLTHRDQFNGPGDYWYGVLLPRLMRHLYRS